MNTVMTWVKVSDLIEKNKSFQIIHKTKNGTSMWCLVRNSTPVMYQEVSSDIQPFFNVYCLIEESNINNSIINKPQIKAFATGISHV